MTDEPTFEPADAVDRELLRRFDVAARGFDDPDMVLDALRPSMRRAQTRRRVALGGVAAAVLAVVAVGVSSLSGSPSQSVHTPPAGHSSTRVPAPAPTTQGADVAVPGATDGQGATDSSGGSSSSGDDSTGAASAPVAGTSSGDGAATTPTTPPAGTTTSYTSDGGSITVSFVNGVVSLVSSTPTAGYSATVHDNGPTRVEVRFDNGTGEWRIRVDVVNGALVPEVTHSGG